MKIIKDDFNIRCKHCLTKLGFEVNDIIPSWMFGKENDGIGIFTSRRISLYIVCPNCAKYIWVNKAVEDADEYVYDKILESAKEKLNNS